MDLVDYNQSGDMGHTLYTFPPRSRVTRAEVRVTGEAFQGKLKFLKGVKVTPSPIVYGIQGAAESPTGSKQAFIIDFTGIRSILRLELLNSKGLITLVLPWLGTDFSQKPVYPVTAPVDGEYLPKAEVTGSDIIGLTGIETTKLLVQIEASGDLLTEAEFLENCRITNATFPSNVKASINGRLPFWTHPGVLNNTAELKGLEDDLNTFLNGAEVLTPVKLFLATDTPGVFRVDFDSGEHLDVVQWANARWGNQTTLDVPLQALYPQAVTISFPVRGNKPWLIERLVLDLAGRFPVWRAFSDQGSDSPGRLGMRISAKFSVARRVVFEEVGELYGFSFLLGKSAGEAEIRSEVFAEKDSQPDPDKSLVKAMTSLPEETFAVSRWVDVMFPSPTKIDPQKGMWMVAKAKTGSAEWAGVTEPLSTPTGTLYSNEGGLWQPYPLVEGKSPATQIRVLRQPFIRENIALLDITWNTNNQMCQQSTELLEETSRVELNLPRDQAHEISPDSGTVSLPLVMVARASGTLTIKGVTAFYKEKST